MLGASRLGDLGGLEVPGAQEGQAGLEGQELLASQGARADLLLLASRHLGTQGVQGGLVPLWGLEFQEAQWGH